MGRDVTPRTDAIASMGIIYFEDKETNDSGETDAAEPTGPSHHFKWSNGEIVALDNTTFIQS